MKKILVLTPRFPYPVIGGDRLRIYRLCEQLSKQYQLTLLSLCESQDEMDMVVSDSVFTDIHRVYLSKKCSTINALLAIPSRVPLQIAYYQSRSFADKLEELLPSHDGTLSHLIRVGDYVKGEAGVHLLEMTDAISLNYKRVRDIASKRNLKSIIYSIEQHRLERYERQVKNGFALTSLVSEIDKSFLFGIDSENVMVCGNGVDTAHLPFVHRNFFADKPINLIFIGNMLSMQNMDAVSWFSKEVLPLLNASGSFSLKVIGLSLIHI